MEPRRSTLGGDTSSATATKRLLPQATGLLFLPQPQGQSNMDMDGATPLPCLYPGPSEALALLHHARFLDLEANQIIGHLPFGLALVSSG